MNIQTKKIQNLVTICNVMLSDLLRMFTSAIVVCLKALAMASGPKVLALRFWPRLHHCRLAYTHAISYELSESMQITF